MLGSSNTAHLTFSGGTRPKCVNYMRVEMRCTEYRPTVQMCLECMQEGHLLDVCPNPKNICRGCGPENPPPQGHECEVKCAVCRAAGHETRRCPNKLIAAQRGKTTRQSLSWEQSRQNTKNAPGHWFELTEAEDFYRRRSRSRSPHGSTAKSNTPSSDPSSSRQRKSHSYPDTKLLGSLSGSADSGEDSPLPCPTDHAGLIDSKHARLAIRPSAATPPRSPDEEVFAPDVSSSSVPSTGLLRVTTSMPTMQQQCATDSSKTQDATPQDSPLRDVNVNLSAIVPTDTGDPMNVQPSGGSTNAAKRGPPVNVLQQDAIASEQPRQKR
ncbi:hypothetical protein HPB49_007785 [Dermacentor silvarum]|uniref:Uncharacterized protein n=1 Tax=Dermacentor silvarum TaxID=543639 RepID=A0ACB8DWX7_DERSI|nr:hypothetical protein HPB49_007785 [Dermacentor silvarum]